MQLRYYVRLKCTQNVTFLEVFLLFFNNSRGCYLKVFITVEFEFEVKNIDFWSKRCENRHLKISLKIVYFQFSPFPFFINRPPLPY